MRGPRGVAAAGKLATLVNDGEEEVWVLYHYFTCEGRSHYFSTCRRPHVQNLK